MLMRKSITLGSGIIIGAWVGIEYPDFVKQIFQAPIVGLAGVLVSFWLSYKNETTPIDPQKSVV
jgi:hypothetical protein